jgi:aspartate aminotransferase
MADYTLRRTDVNRAVDRARSLGRRNIIDARLGDPTVFKLGPFPRYRVQLEHAICDPKSFSYTESSGLPQLREVLASGSVEFGENGYVLPIDNVFVGSGVSGVARTLFTAIINKGDEIAIPEWSYIIYFAEAALRGAKVANVRLTESGQVDLEHLESSINRNTKAVFITTVGNPLGVAISHESFTEVLNIVNRREREFNHPIWLVFDTIYENYRSGSPSIDPIGKVLNHGRFGPTVEFYSISKTIAAPGARLGWMRIAEGTDFKEETGEFLEALARLYQPALGKAPVVFQMALAGLYKELDGDKGRRGDFDRYRAEIKEASLGRVRRFITGLSDIDGVVFPRCYYNGSGVDPTTMHSFYVLFGVDSEISPRNGTSQARELADFLIGQEDLPIVFTTPGDSFLASNLRGQRQEFVRAVALSDRTPEMVEGIRRFVQSKK